MSNSIATGVAYADQNITNSDYVCANALTGQLGFSTGGASVAVPSVTQATSKSTGVTLNAAAGNVVMNNAALAGGASVTFTLTNSVIGLYDVVVASVGNGYATAGSYRAQVNTTSSSGSASITVTNTTGGSLSEAVVVNFMVLSVAQV